MRQDYLTTPKGTRDILLEECEAKNWVEEKLAASFRAYGYQQVITPGIEYLDVYAKAPGNAGSEHMLKLVDSEGRILVLRPDSTGPIARLASSRLKQSSKPLRLCYNQNVFRQKGIYSGRPLETAQMGIEFIGAEGLKADVEMLLLAEEALRNCGLREFRIELGHGGLCELLMSRLAVAEGDKDQLKQMIRSKNYPALNDFLDFLGKGDEVRGIKALPGLFGGLEVFDKASEVFGVEDREAREILGYLRSLFDILWHMGFRDNLMIDLGFVNFNDYYTGVIFQGFIHGFGEAVLSGGRYDKLLERFGDKLPAVGFGINVDLLAKYRLDNALQPPPAAPDALVWGGQGYDVACMRYAQKLRQKPGMIVEHALLGDVEECKAYAAAKGIPQVHVVGQAVEIIEIERRQL